MRSLTIAGALLAAVSLAGMPRPAPAEEIPVFRIEMKDGTITPSRIEVPANARFKLEIHNTGVTPAEFESVELRKEKVLTGGSSSSLVFNRLDPGEYGFFDDFHPEAKATLVAK